MKLNKNKKNKMDKFHYISFQINVKIQLNTFAYNGNAGHLSIEHTLVYIKQC